MTLSIKNAVVDLTERGAAVLVLGGRLWIARDRLGPLSASGTYDLGLEIAVRGVATPSGSYTALNVLRVIDAKPCKG